MHMRETVQENPLLAILRGVPTDIIKDYVGAILEGGVAFFEVALNSADALQQIRMLRQTFGTRICVGGGTVIHVDRAKAAVAAGAQFLLSPSTDEAVLTYCKHEKIAMLPGVLTPTDVSVCLQNGFDILKLFPAGNMPMGYIKSLKGPFDDTDYVAIGGVDSQNAADFIRQGCLGVGLGSAVLPKKAVETADWAAASRYVADMLANIRAAKASAK